MHDRRPLAFRWLIRCAWCGLTIGVLLTATGCDTPQSSSPSNTVTEYSLYSAKAVTGTWTAQSVTVSGQTYSIMEYSALKREDFSSTYTLQEDGTAIMSNNNQSLEGTYSFDGKAADVLFGKYHYRLVYDAQTNTLTRTKDATDERITYRKN